MHPEQTVGLTVSFTIGHLALIGQKGRRLGEKHAKCA
jgi:hypothetical protein